MTKRFKTERAAQQQGSICGALVALMEEAPYEKITVSDICRRADIPRRTFYYYYEGKEELLGDLLQQILRECNLETMFTADSDRSSVEQGFARFFRYWRDRRSRELNALLRNDLGQRLVNGSLQWMKEDDQWHGVLTELPRDRQTVGVLLGMTCVFYTLFYWQASGFALGPEEVAAHVTDILTNPIYRVN